MSSQMTTNGTLAAAASSSPSSSFQDALDRMAMGGSTAAAVGTASASAAAASAASSSQNRQEFIPSTTWKGSKVGYYFGTNQQGTGYYLDTAVQSNNDITTTTTTKKRKGVQIAEDRNEMVFVPSNNNNNKSSGSSLLEQAEQKAKIGRTNGTVVMELTPKGLRSATNALLKVVQQNSMLRAQYAPHNPQQYMESEITLYEHITSLSAIAANIQLYQYLLVSDNNQDMMTSSSSSLLSTLLQLLGEHDNSDVCASIISLFLEWIDPTLVLQNNNEGNDDDRLVLPKIIGQLTHTIVVQAWDTIVANLGRFQQPKQQLKDNNTGEEEEEEEEDDDDPTLKGIDNILNLMENILELDLLIPDGGIMNVNNNNNDNSNQQQSVAAYMVQETQIISWLLEQVEEKDDDDDDDDQRTKKKRKRKSTEDDELLSGRCLELLAFLAQREDVHTVHPDWNELPPYQSHFLMTTDDNNDNTKKRKTKHIVQGMEILLQAIGKYRKKQPDTERQVEYLENASIVISSCLTYSPSNVSAFLQGQGIELVLRCLKEQVHSGGCSLKLLDYFGSHTVHKSACEHVIDTGGLKYILPMFMGTRIPKPALLSTSSTSSKAKKAKREWLHLIETQTIRILYALTRHLDDSSPKDAKARLVAKFVEDSNKCDRLVELILSYDQKALKAEYLFYRSDIEDQVVLDEASGGDGGAKNEETVQLAALDAKLKGGGEIFHRLGAIAAFLCIHSKRCHERILSQLQLQQSGISVIKAALEEFISVLGSGHQKDQLQSYVDQL